MIELALAHKLNRRETLSSSLSRRLALSLFQSLARALETEKTSFVSLSSLSIAQRPNAASDKKTKDQSEKRKKRNI